MKRKPSPAVAISLIALFFSLTGAGFAASRYVITSNSQIKPSVLHTLKGASGPQGIAGPQGPAGIDGTSNTFDTVKFYYRTSATQDLTPQQPTATVQLQCDGGDRIINGGYVGQNEIVTTDAPVTVIPAEWDVTAHLDPNAASGSVAVWMACAVRGT